MMTNCVAALVVQAQKRFADAGISSALLDAQLLVGLVANMSRTQVVAYPERMLDNEALARLVPLIESRAKRVPLAYLIGTKEFYGREFEVSPHVLIPRPETELVIETMLTLSLPQGPILELGIGSGAISITLALEFAARHRSHAIVASDISHEALAVAQRNAAALGAALMIDFRSGDWFDAVHPGERFSAIVSNPPYVCLEARDTSPEIAFEPSNALYSGADGLNDVRVIIAHAQQHLTSGGVLVLEHGMEQATAIAQIVDSVGGSVETKKDLGGLDRVSLISFDRS